MIPIYELLDRLKRNEVRIWPEGDKLKYSAPEGVMTPDLLEVITQNKDGLLEILHQIDVIHSPERSPIQRYPRPDILPLSYAQERMWFLHQLEGEHPAYNVFKALRLKGQLDIISLENSLTVLVSRHESLRTSFPVRGSSPCQRIFEPMLQPLPVHDLQKFNEADQLLKFQNHARDFGTMPFDLENGPLFRTTLIQLSPEDHILLLNMHHIITDGWSLGILFAELRELYEASSTGRPTQLDELPIQYSDFTLWQRKWFQADRMEPLIDFWRKHLKGAPEAITLNTDNPRPPIATFIGDEIPFQTGRVLAEEIRDLGEKAGTTPFMTLLAAYAVLLHRYSGMDDLVIGSPVANRTFTELEGIIGFFVNSLALRIDLKDDPTFMELLGRVRKTALEGYSHQDLPFEILVKSLKAERDLSRNPIFQVMFSFQSQPSIPKQIGNLDVESMDIPLGISSFDINLMIWEELEDFSCRWEYNSDLFHRDTAVQMSKHLLAILSAVIREPGLPLSKISFLSERERNTLLNQWNATSDEHENLGCVHELVENQIARTPDEIAIEYEDKKISYHDLNQKANQLAHNLQKHGVGPDVLVGLYMQRSINSLLAILGVLKAGGGYVPLDPTYPKERIAFMILDSQVRVILTDEDLLPDLPENLATVISLDDNWQAFCQESEDNPVSDVNDHNLAYVMFTSGSTGLPKGVAMPHRALSNLIYWQLQHSTVPKAKTLQFTTLSFDVSFQEIFATWCGGGTLVFIPDKVKKDFQLVGKVMSEAHVERLFIPFAGLQHLADVLSDKTLNALDLKEINTAGEQLQITPQIIHLISYLKDCVLHNQYGPTETHVVTAHKLTGNPQGWPKLPPIGRPINNSQIFILDNHLEPVPIGVTGELHVGGCCIARGYLNRPEEDHERFIPHPFEDKEESRLYKTGDLARYLPNGEIEFLGRLDDQVKIRGFRVELGEIETILGGLPDIQTCAVSMRGDRPSNQQIIAYIVLREGIRIDIGDIKKKLRQKLPEYMVPGSIIQMKSLPMTPSGKVDRRVLPEPRSARSEQVKNEVRPRDFLEQQIAEVWEKLLGVHPIGVQEDFFDIGGHSLLVVGLITGIAERTGITLPIASIFQSPTVEDQAKVIRTKEWNVDVSSVVAIRSGGLKPPLFCVHSLGGDVLNYHALAHRLSQKRTIYGILAKGLGGRTSPLTTIEEMARHYINDIKSIQATGPYHLAGSSMGGNIAFEIARQFRKMGEEVGVVALFDSLGEPKLSLQAIPKKVQYHSAELKRRTLQGKLRYLYIRSWKKTKWGFFKLFALTSLPLPKFFWKQKLTNYHAFLNYLPGQFEGDIILFRAIHRGTRNTQPLYLGWDKFVSGNIKLIEVPGIHTSVLKGPGVRAIAQTLDQSFNDFDNREEESVR